MTTEIHERNWTRLKELKAVMPPRVLITTFGSLGDIHPYIALSLGLQQRGFEPIFATSEYYREKITSLGIPFRSIRPDHPGESEAKEWMKRLMDLNRGSEYVVREYIAPVINETYADTLAAAEGVDLLVSHPLTYATPIVAEQKKLPWVSTMLSPIGFFSASDPPVIGPIQFLSPLRVLGPIFWGPLFSLAKWVAKDWVKPVVELRHRLGLPPSKESPLFEGQNSPYLVLSMFSKSLAKPAKDWPQQAQVTGFCFYDMSDRAVISPELSAFLDAGDPPIVFTLGSAAVLDAGSFYEQSAKAAEAMGRRAVLLVGSDAANRPQKVPASIFVADYAPYSKIFPRAAAIVHQGGVGTTSQAMRSGRPMLVMPYAHDQPDNADRVKRLGVARSIPRAKYNAVSAQRELSILLGDSRYSTKAEEVGVAVRAEDGVAAACEAIESTFFAKHR